MHLSFYIVVESSRGRVLPLRFLSLIYRDQRLCLQPLYLSWQALVSSPLATSVLFLKVGDSVLSFKCDRSVLLFYWIECLRLSFVSYHAPQCLGSSLEFDSFIFYWMLGLSCSRLVTAPHLSFCFILQLLPVKTSL